jgi:U3 small nucleolar RNA-associated protein 22
VARGNASKAFQPFMLPGDLRGSLDKLKNKLLVDFDPLRCYIADLEVSVLKCLVIQIDHVALNFLTLPEHL